MIQQITAFKRDELGDWVAILSCGHTQHVRHRPPFFNRPWTVTEAGRAEKIGAPLECPECYASAGMKLQPGENKESSSGRPKDQRS